MQSKSILITGCSSGIGLASARTMAARGWQVLATARSTADLQMLAGIPGVTPLQLELRDQQSIARCAAEALERTEGALFALFNNAAFGQPGAMEDITPELLRDQLEVNVVGTHALTRGVLPAMRANGAGRIVQCSSVLGLVSGPYRGAYSASKFALEGMSDALRLELAGSGIAVSIIEPGPIRTRFVETSLALAERNLPIETSVHRDRYLRLLATLRSGGRQRFKLEPQAVADRLVHAIESPRPKIRYYVTTPTFLAVGAKRLLPLRVIDWIAARS